MEKTKHISKKNKLVFAYIDLVITAIFWGLATVLIKKHINQIPTYHLMSARFGIGALIVFLIAPKKILKMEKQDVKIGLKLSILVFASYSFLILALLFTSASKTGFLTSLSVLFVPIVQSVLNKRLPSKWTILGICLSLIGLYLISGMNGTSMNFGDFLVILGALCSTAYIILLSKLGKNIDDYKLSFLQLSFTFIFSFFIACFNEGLNLSVIKENIVVLLIIGITGTGLTTFLQTKAQKIASPESTGIILLGEPVTTLILAYLLLQETILFKGIIGCILIIISLIITILKNV